MISRQWKGIAKRSEADRYIDHLRTETFVQIANLPGFRNASILRRDVAEGVEFLIVTTWASLDAIRRFAGDDPERAVVPPRVQEMMISYDRTVDHYEVVE